MTTSDGRASAACLAGFRVIECASGAGGAFCGRLLATLGADVIKVEPPSGDITRRWGPFVADVPDRERSLLFLHLNLNKRGITLDTESPTGKMLLRRMLADTDALILEEPAWPVEEIQELSTAYPQMIVAVMRPFGLDGPYASYLAGGLNLYQAGGDGYLNPSGLAYHTHPDRQPLNLAGHTSDGYCGLATAIGILAAAHARTWAGGQLIDISKHEAHVSISREQLMWYANDGSYETRATHQFAFGGTLPCRDGYIEVYAAADHQWEALVELMGQPEWSRDEHFRDVGYRAEHGEEIQRHLFEWAAGVTMEEVYRGAQRLGAAVGKFNTPADVVGSGQEQARGYFVPKDHPVVGIVPYPFTPYKLSETPCSLVRPAPLLGQHNGEVYEESLGLTGAEMTTLRQLGVI